jgi:hypothetical protein
MIYKNMAFVCLGFAIAAVWALAFESRSWAGEPGKGIGALSDAALAKLAQAKIYFGHQSVGNNIMAGVGDLIRQNPRLKLKIEETAAPAGLQNVVFAHGPVGKNENPASKIDDFAAKIRAGVGGSADIAFFKFCYIDIMADRNIDELFAHYQKTMSDLKKSYPKTTFVHVTVPLTIVQTGPKVFIKKMIGRAPGGFEENAKRSEYNRKLRQAYEGKEPVFDLAKIESTYADGSRATFDWQGQTYERMIPEYGSDGRHLNEPGRQLVAEHLIVFISGLLTKQSQ